MPCHFCGAEGGGHPFLVVLSRGAFAADGLRAGSRSRALRGHACQPCLAKLGLEQAVSPIVVIGSIILIGLCILGLDMLWVSAHLPHVLYVFLVFAAMPLVLYLLDRPHARRRRALGREAQLARLLEQVPDPGGFMGWSKINIFANGDREAEDLDAALVASEQPAAEVVTKAVYTPDVAE